MAWIVLFVAGLMEIGWAIGLKYTEGFTRLVPSVLTLACMAGSILLLGLALKTLPKKARPCAAAAAKVE
jgi:quaternary ammonium compound-resistance protein SugE